MAEICSLLKPKVLRKATTVLGMDEPCWFLAEMNQPTPDYKGVHRYRTLTVYRGDEFVDYRHDLGPAVKFTIDEFQVPGGAREWKHGKWWYYIEHTVGELLDIAHKLHDPSYVRPDRPQPSDLIGYYNELPDRQRKKDKALSTFGAEVRVQRS